jgi:hypothetical protein
MATPLTRLIGPMPAPRPPVEALSTPLPDDVRTPIARIAGARRARSELLLLPGEGHTIVGRDHLVELSGRVAAWFDRWL